MKYYSEKTGEKYSTIKELDTAEKNFDEKQKAVSAASEEKKILANKVTEAYKNAIEVSKQANAMVMEAGNKYLSLRREFIAKYGSFHMTYSNENGKENIVVDTQPKLIDEINDFMHMPVIW